MTVRALDLLAGACFAIRNSRTARTLFVLAMMAAVLSAVFARPKQLESLTVKNYALREVSISTADRYVRVAGLFRPDEAYQRYLKVPDTCPRSSASKFVQLADPTSGISLCVLDENLPNVAHNAPVTLVGRVELGTGSSELPPYYLIVGDPPNVRLANLLARLGAVVMMLGVAGIITMALVQRAAYALPSLFRAAPAVSDAPALLWYGDLGRHYDGAVLREEPGRFVAGIHETRIESLRQPGLWTVHLRRLRSAHLFDAATRYGPLPAVHLRFDDERGLPRHGVIVTNCVAARDAAIELLGLIRHQ